MDVFDTWDEGTGSSPDNSPTRTARSRGGGASATSAASEGRRIGGVAMMRKDYASDIFTLRRMDLASPRGLSRSAALRSIQHAAVQSNMMVLAMSDASIIRWSLDGTMDPEPIQISSSSTSSRSSSTTSSEEIYKIFLDPTGNHLIISLTNAEHYYLHARASKPKKLTKWQGFTIESIAFDKFYGSEQSTKSILLGSNRGVFYETVLEASPTARERPLTKVHELEQPLAIRAIEFEIIASSTTSSSSTITSTSTSIVDSSSSFSASSALSGSLNNTNTVDSNNTSNLRMIVLAATSNPIRLYKFIGGPSFEAMFLRHRESGSLNFQDFGGSPKFPSVELHLHRQSLNSRAESLALLTDSGIFHGRLALSPPPSSTDALITEATLTDHLTSDGRSLSEEGPHPISMAVSDFHFMVLYPKRLQVVSKLSGKQVQENSLEPTESYGYMRSVLRDLAQGTYWVYSDQAIYQLSIRDEDRYVWRLYLEKALQGDVRKFDLAYKYCKDPHDRAQVDGAQAAYYFKNGQYELSATFYGKSSNRSFEEIALKFVEDGQEKALGVFLLEKLALMGGGGTSSTSSISSGNVLHHQEQQFKTQRVMLCTWLTEIYLKRLTALGVPGSAEGSSEYEATVNEFRAFLRKHVEDLKIHPPTTYQLLGSHGRRQEILLYASLIEDLDRVISFHTQEGNYSKALSILESALFERVEQFFYNYADQPMDIESAPFERVEQFFYKYAYQLMEAEPTRTVAVWMNKPGLNPSKLIPALVRHIQMDRPDKQKADLDMVIRYLEACITGAAQNNSL